jgi:serine/threonine protein kinase
MGQNSDSGQRVAFLVADDRHVTHRDISQDNILFDRADNLKVADFGLARIWGMIA